jgi:hypothetical protein
VTNVSCEHLLVGEHCSCEHFLFRSWAANLHQNWTSWSKLKSCNRLNVSEKKFRSGHRVFVNIVHKQCSGTLFANIVRLGLYPPLGCLRLVQARAMWAYSLNISTYSLFLLFVRILPVLWWMPFSPCLLIRHIISILCRTDRPVSLPAIYCFLWCFSLSLN